MITVNNTYETESTDAASIDIGEAFLGRVADIDGEERSGVFIRTATGLTLLDDPSVEFDTFTSSDSGYAPKVFDYQTADITVNVEDAW